MIDEATPYQQHVADWVDCQRCVLRDQRRKVVIARGQIPCEVLMLGEAPGQSEDALGLPFVGPAGQLLDRIIYEAMPVEDGVPKHRVAFTNVVACFPRDAKGTSDHSPPTEAVRACAARVKEFVAIARPRLIVCVGETAKKYVHLGVDTAGAIKVVGIIHPAAVLRMPYAQKGMAVQRAVATLEDALLGLDDETAVSP